MLNQLDPFSIKVLKYLQKHPDITTDEMRKKFGDSIESLLNELYEEHYVKNRSGDIKDWDNWFIDDKGINALSSEKYTSSLSVADRIITAIISFVVGIAVGCVVSCIK